MLRILWKIFKILMWQKKTFKNTWKDQMCKVAEESLEYTDAVYFNDDDRMLEEGADVIISSIGALRFEEVWELIEAKMKKNLKREWVNDHHVVKKSRFM